MREITLREMQQIELELLAALDDVCAQHGLRYYMTASSPGMTTSISKCRGRTMKSFCPCRKRFPLTLFWIRLDRGIVNIPF